MRKLTCYDLDCLSIGSAILGSGGGGDPTYNTWMAKYQLEGRSPITLLNVNEIQPNDLIVPLAFMGAPLVDIERIPSGREFIQMFPILEKTIGRPASILMAAEVGGSNAFTPLIAACQLGLPVLDADTIGRAFPELQMSSCHLQGIPAAPAFLTDCFGNTVTVHAKNSFSLEKLARQTAVAMGSCCAAALYLMSAQQVTYATIPGSLSQAIEIGNAFLKAQEQKKSPVDAVLALTKGIRLGIGKITDIQQVIDRGFLIGDVTIEEGSKVYKLTYQNEYLMVTCQDQILATTPDIIMLFELDTANPITSESLRFGLQVEIVALHAPSLWQTPQGLSLVGPQAFGLKAAYTSIQSLIKHKE